VESDIAKLRIMANIRKITGKTGTAYQVRYASKERSSGYGYSQFDTMKAARDFIENLGSLREAPSGQTLSVSESIDRWIDICEKIGRDGRERVEPETFKEYRRRARVMKEYVWSKRLHELAPSDVIQFRNWLLEHKTRDLARRTLSSFHSVIIEMKQQGFIRDDPAAGATIKAGGRYEDEDGEVTIPTDQEMRDIYAAADRMGRKNAYVEKCWARYRPMIYLAGFSGMRPSEYRGLPWSNLSDGRILVRQRADRTGIIGPVKSKAGRRTIYVPTLVTDMIFEWQERCPDSSLGLVFPTESGKPVALTNFTISAWQPLMKEAGLVDQAEDKDGKSVQKARYTPYALRHYYASKLIELGRDFKSIQTALGHSSIEITFNVYGHLIRDKDDAHREAAETLMSSLLQG
jgi:integrase